MVPWRLRCHGFSFSAGIGCACFCVALGVRRQLSLLTWLFLCGFVTLHAPSSTTARWGVTASAASAPCLPLPCACAAEDLYEQLRMFSGGMFFLCDARLG